MSVPAKTAMMHVLDTYIPKDLNPKEVGPPRGLFQYCPMCMHGRFANLEPAIDTKFRQIVGLCPKCGSLMLANTQPYPTVVMTGRVVVPIKLKERR